MRNAFIDEITKQARVNPKIALVVGDLGFSVVEPFAREFPDRFINAGVAEQNMMGMAAGMASEGFQVFVYSIGNFPTFRCAEQIRNDVDYHKLSVTIVVVGGGVSYGALGYSHHTIQDYALMRSFPNTLIASPGDALEVRACVRYILKNPQPSYLRLAKSGEPIFHSKIPEVKPGKWLKLAENKKKKNNKNILLSTGGILPTVISMKNLKKYSDYIVMTLPLWGQKYKLSQLKYLRKANKIVSFEDHLSDGGFGSWLLEAANNKNFLTNKIKIKSLNTKVCGAVGSQKMLHKFSNYKKN